MKKILIIAFIPIGLFLTLFAFNLFKQPQEAVYVPSKISINPLADTTLKDVVFLNWDKTLLEIAKTYPKGEMAHHPPRTTLATYIIDATLTDIKEPASLAFSQNEDFIKGKTQENISVRSITFIAQTPDEQKIKFESICSLISTFKKGLLPTKGDKRYDASYHISNSDDTGGIYIGLMMETNLNNSIYLYITRFKVIESKS